MDQEAWVVLHDTLLNVISNITGMLLFKSFITEALYHVLYFISATRHKYELSFHIVFWFLFSLHRQTPLVNQGFGESSGVVEECRTLEREVPGSSVLHTS
jgi:hypothetical protein